MATMRAWFVAAVCVVGCHGSKQQEGPPATSEPAPRCETPAPASVEPGEGSNVLGGALAPCSPELKTGWFRDGTCRTDADDHGVHVVCAQVTSEFLSFSRERGNDLITPRPELRFPGLKAGDRWCLCAARWGEAQAAGVAPPVVVEATHAGALRHLDKASLLRRALPDERAPH